MKEAFQTALTRARTTRRGIGMKSDTRFVPMLPEDDRLYVVWLCFRATDNVEDFERAINSRVCDIEELIGESNEH